MFIYDADVELNIDLVNSLMIDSTNFLLL